MEMLPTRYTPRVAETQNVYIKVQIGRNHKIIHVVNL